MNHRNLQPLDDSITIKQVIDKHSEGCCKQTLHLKPILGYYLVLCGKVTCLNIQVLLKKIGLKSYPFPFSNKK